jgi:hypothetical protein
MYLQRTPDSPDAESAGFLILSSRDQQLQVGSVLFLLSGLSKMSLVRYSLNLRSFFRQFAHH